VLFKKDVITSNMRNVVVAMIQEDWIAYATYVAGDDKIVVRGAGDEFTLP
jgi:hypothetical protein